MKKLGAELKRHALTADFLHVTFSRSIRITDRDR